MFSIKFNDLMFTRPPCRETRTVESVEYFDTPGVLSALQAGAPPSPMASDREKRPGIVRRVTFVQPLRLNMSHRFSTAARWHACCSYTGISGAAAPLGSKRARVIDRKNAGSGRKASRRTPRAPDNNEKTLLHTSKRPTTPPLAGFFFARTIVGEMPATDKWQNPAHAAAPG